MTTYVVPQLPSGAALGTPNSGAVSTPAPQLGIYQVADFGGVLNGVANDTGAVNLAMQTASLNGGGIVQFGGNMRIDPIVIPANVTLQGNQPGPYSEIYQTTIQDYPVLIANSTGSSLVTMAANDSHIRDLGIYYPNQVQPTASTPNIYPFAITSPTTNNGGNSVDGVTIINASHGITGAFARGHIANCLIGAFVQGIVVDSTADFFWMNNVFHQVMWDVFAGLGHPQNIDTYVTNNATALFLLRVDGYVIMNWGVFGASVGIVMADSPLAISPLNSYGHLTNIEIDTVKYGINALSTNGSGGGAVITSMNSASSITDVNLGTGGSSPPKVFWNGGTSRGAGHYSVTAGQLICKFVAGITDNTANLAPSFPASNTPITNPYPFDCMVYVMGGTVANVDINGVVISTGTGSGGSYMVKAGQTFAVNYTGSPTWVWFAQ